MRSCSFCLEILNRLNSVKLQPTIVIQWWSVTCRPHCKTSRKQSKDRELHMKLLHRETNNNTLYYYSTLFHTDFDYTPWITTKGYLFAYYYGYTESNFMAVDISLTLVLHLHTFFFKLLVTRSIQNEIHHKTHTS